MKKKVLLFLVLATLVAGGTFAQNVGDTANVFGKNYTVKDIRNGEIILMLTPTLDGTWKNGGGDVITFNGNNAVFKQFGTDAFIQSAIKKGFIKIGDQVIRNLKKTGDLTWSGQGRQFQWTNDAPDVCIGTIFVDVTITLSADGKTFTGAGTYTRQ